MNETPFQGALNLARNFPTFTQSGYNKTWKKRFTS